jgi:transposase-like protein
MVLLSSGDAMAAYSMDLRQRVVRACDLRDASAAVAAQFEVSLAWVYRVRQCRRATGSIEPRKQTKSRSRSLSSDEEARLVSPFLACVEQVLVPICVRVTSSSTTSRCKPSSASRSRSDCLRPRNASTLSGTAAIECLRGYEKPLSSVPFLDVDCLDVAMSRERS